MQSYSSTPSHSRSHSPASLAHLSLDLSHGHSTPGSLLPGQKQFLPSRRNSLGIVTGLQGSFSMDNGSDRTPSYLPPRRAPSHSARDTEASTSGIAFHMPGSHTMGLILDGIEDESSLGANRSSRSETPPSSGTTGSGAGASPASLSFDQLCSIGSLLATAIPTSYETKRKDAHGKVYHNCFQGKEALNALRQKLRGTSADSCQAILHQMLCEGFLSPAQSLEELDRIIAAKFVAPPTAPASASGSRGQSPKLGPQTSSNPLAIKLNLSSIGAAAHQPPLQFKKDGLYQLTSLWRSGSGHSSTTGSATNSKRNSPLTIVPNIVIPPPHSGSGASTPVNAPAPTNWFTNYAGFLGKKRENKGLGNSLALGFGVSAYQKRWFVCSQRDGGVLYYKDDPNSCEGGGVSRDLGREVLSPPSTTSSVGSAASCTSPPPLGAAASANGGYVTPFPLGFIPFSEILLVDHMASSAASANNNSIKKRSSMTTLTSPPSCSNLTLHFDEKSGRLFDLIASFRIYHLQADTAMEAMKWVTAIRENTKEWLGGRESRMLGNSAQQGLNSAATHGGYGTMRPHSTPPSHAPAPVRTPRTPDHTKRFWSNSSTPNLNPSAFPSQYLTQVLRDSVEGRNGFFGLGPGGPRQTDPQRISPLRRHFFELFFSISSLDQPNYFDSLMADFECDESIVRFAWDVIMRSGMRTGVGVTTGKDEEAPWEPPRSFRRGGALPAASPSVAAVGGRNSITSTLGFLDGKPFVDPSASLTLLARMQQEEFDEESTLDEDEYSQMGGGGTEDSSLRTSQHDTPMGGGGGSVPVSRRSSMVPGQMNVPSLPRAPRHRRAISGSMLPDSLGRGGSYANPLSPSNPNHRREESFNLQALQARRILNATRPFHRRFGSDIVPLPRAILDDSCQGRATKFRDVSYMLLNKYALFHASAYKIPANTGGANVENKGFGPLNPPFLYRIFHPLARMESWVATDCFLNLLLNDAALLNEVPLALALIWLILQWRNHDPDAHNVEGGAFQDDSYLRKNWMDPSVDGEDDGFAGEEDEQPHPKEGEKRKGFRGRAHLRVNSFSTLIDPRSIHSHPSTHQPISPLTARSPLSPTPNQSTLSAPPLSATNASIHHVPVVHGPHGQTISSAMKGGSNRSSLINTGHAKESNAQPVVGGISALPGGSPLSSSLLYEYEPATPLSPSPDTTPLKGPVRMHLQKPTQPMSELTVSISPMGASVGSEPLRMHRNQSMDLPSPKPRKAAVSVSSSCGSPPAGTPPRDVHFALDSPATPATLGGSGGAQVSFLLEGERELSSSASSESREFDSGTRSGDTAPPMPLPPGVQLLEGGRPFSMPLGGKGSQSVPTTRRNSVVGASPPAAMVGVNSQTGTPVLTGRRGGVPPPPPLPSSKSTPATPTKQMRSRERGCAVFQASSGTSRGVNLLPGAGGGYATLRGSSSMPNSVPPPIPLGMPHWKTRSLTHCKFCYESSREFAWIVSERYSIDGASVEARRIREAKRAARKLEMEQGIAKRNGVVIDPPPSPASELSISIANTLFTLLLTPVHSIPYSLNSTNDSLNVLGKTIVSAHIWPSIVGCLHRKTTSMGGGAPSLAAGIKSPSTTTRCATPTGLMSPQSMLSPSAHAALGLPPTSAIPPPPPHLTHHVLKDLNTLFLSLNTQANNRNCSLLFKYFDMVSVRERKDGEAIQAELDAEKKLDAKEREKLERRRRRKGITQPQRKFLVGSWQEGLLDILRHHVPQHSVLPGDDPSTERLHSKIFQYALNLFGIFHFYKFHCVSPNSSATCGGNEFERVVRESFWKCMGMDEATLAARAAVGWDESATSTAVANVLSPLMSARSPPRPKSIPPSLYAQASLPLVAQPVSRALLLTLLQRLIFKLKSKSVHLEHRWGSLAFLVGLVKSFVFSMSMKQSMSGSNGTILAASPTPSNSGSSPLPHSPSPDPLLPSGQDFPPGGETLHVPQPGAAAASGANFLNDDIELLEKTLELLRALRLYQEMDPETLLPQKQLELRSHVEAIAANSAKGSRVGELHDPLSKLRLNTAHDELTRLYASLGTPDQQALRFMQQQVSFLKDSVVFLAIMQNHIQKRGRGGMDEKELNSLVSHFVSIERREKVFCNSK